MCKFMIYVILHTKTYNIIYVGQTIQPLEKRISRHIETAKILQKFHTFKEQSHKSLIAYRLAVTGIENIRVLP